ncbi:MAG TPA: IclR family transcriptional regulator [bacterium]|nr:IclR family transcriptional regulator [bacterium]
MPKKRAQATGSENVLKIIEILASRGKVRVRELARELNIAPSTAMRFLRTLVQSGFAAVDEETRLYRPGLHFLQVAIQLQEQFTLTRVARPVLENLFSRVHETVNLGVLSDDLRDVIHVDKIVTDRVVRIDTSIGRTAPSYCTALGKAMLAFRPTVEVGVYIKQADLIPHTPNTLVDPTELVRHLGDVRRKGYAVDLEEYSEHLECVAAPVLNDRGVAVAGISISRLVVPGERNLDAVAAEVVRAARALSIFVANAY